MAFVFTLSNLIVELFVLLLHWAMRLRRAFYPLASLFPCLFSCFVSIQAQVICDVRFMIIACYIRLVLRRFECFLICAIAYGYVFRGLLILLRSEFILQLFAVVVPLVARYFVLFAMSWLCLSVIQFFGPIVLGRSDV